MPSPDLFTLLPLAAVLAAAGLCAGLIAGLLGVGGGIVIVPVLFHLLGVVGVDPAVTMHVAVGTSLAAIIPTSIVSLRAHWSRGAVDGALLRDWAPAVALGVLAGTAAAVAARGAVLSAVFAAVALAVAAHMAFSREGTRLADRLPAGPLRHVIPAVIGFISAMMGIGGGTLSVPILSLCSFPIRRAVGTAAAFGLIIAVPGAFGFAINGASAVGRPPASLGYVNLLGWLLISGTSILTAPYGARLAHAIAPERLRKAFAFFLAVTAVRMGWSVMF